MRRVKEQIRHQGALIYSKILQNTYRLPVFGSKGFVRENKELFVISKNALLLNCSITSAFHNKKSILTIISDDGNYSTGKYLKHYTEEYQVPITVAGTVYNIQRHRRFWKNAVTEHMFEVVNHSYNHPRMEEGTVISKDKKRLYHEIVHSKVYFEKLFRKESTVFVCPENEMCSNGYDILTNNGFRAVARGTRGYNELSPEYGKLPGQWFNLFRKGIADKVDGDIANERNSWIETAINENKWLIEMWHNVSEDTTRGYQTVTPKVAEEHLQYIANHKDDLWIALFSDAVKYIYEKQNAKVTSYLENDCLYVYVDIEPLDINVFNQELTVRIDCSGKDFNDYDLSDYTNDKDDRFVYLDVLPGKIIKLHLKRVQRK